MCKNSPPNVACGVATADSIRAVSLSGGILMESCCNVPRGFERDEAKAGLGTNRHVPRWLEPIQVPETAPAR